jgi:2-dehydropantoate 2-reductase
MSRLAIAGGGAVGAYVAALLARAGHQPLIIDQWPDNVYAMNKHGIQVRDTAGEITARVEAIHIHEVQRVREHFDIILLAVKTYDAGWIGHLMKPLLASQGCVISLMNCMPDEAVAATFGPQRTLGCVISRLQSVMWEPGIVERGGAPGRETGHAVFKIGELSGRDTPRARGVAELLDAVDHAQVTSNLWGERWAKLVQNAMSHPVQAMSNLSAEELAADPGARRLVIRIAREAVVVGRALGYSFDKVDGVSADSWARADDPEVYAQLDDRLKNNKKDWQASMAQDLRKGRRTEIADMNGAVVAMADQLSHDAHGNRAAVAAIQAIESGQVAPGRKLLTEVVARAGE